MDAINSTGGAGFVPKDYLRELPPAPSKIPPSVPEGFLDDSDDDDDEVYPVSFFIRFAFANIRYMFASPIMLENCCH